MLYRPVAFVGYGYRLAGMSKRWSCPTLLSWRMADLLPEDDPMCFGRPGSIASKYANTILQAATHIEIVGARLDYPTTGYRPDEFAKDAIRCEIDDTPCDEWLEQCRAWKAQYPLPESWVDGISDTMQEGDILVPSSSGMACEMILQRFKVKKNQRIIFAPGLGSMGFAIPMAVGVAMAAPDKTIYCVEGDGSMAMSVHALQSIRQHNLNIKLYIVENNGYASIRNSQKKLSQSFGCDPSSGLTFPNTQSILDAYGVRGTIIQIDPDTEIHPRLHSTIVDGKIIPGRMEDVS